MTHTFTLKALAHCAVTKCRETFECEISVSPPHYWRALTQPPNGWLSTRLGFFCPEHAQHNLTATQRSVLLSLAPRGRHVRRTEITTCRSLEKLGLVKLEDNGELRINDRSDGERYWAECTDLGRKLVNKESSR